MSPRELKANHMIRVQNSLWNEARAIAKFRGESLSEVIRAALTAYIKKHRGLLEGPTETGEK